VGEYFYHALVFVLEDLPRISPWKMVSQHLQAYYTTNIHLQAYNYIPNLIMDLNLNLNVISQHFTRCQVTKNGLFEQFEYIPSRYSLADEIMMKDRLEDEAVTLSVGGKPFIAGTQKIKLKHETAFEDKVLPGTAFHT